MTARLLGFEMGLPDSYNWTENRGLCPSQKLLPVRQASLGVTVHDPNELQSEEPEPVAATG
jgi:hypothetical protein